LRTRSVGLEVRRFCFCSEVASVGGDRWRDLFQLDLALSPRLHNTRGRYLDRWGASRWEQLGNVIFVPAQTLFRGESGAGLCHTSSCYLDPKLFDIDPREFSDQTLKRTLYLHDTAIRRSLARMTREVLRPAFATPFVVEAAGMILADDLSRLF